MGSGRNYNPSGGFYAQEWEYKGESVENIKILYNTKDERTNGLPKYSNTSDAYFRKMHGDVVQIRFYEDRLASMDIDIIQSGTHKNKDGTVFTGAIAHVHEWSKDSKGEYVRNREARYMTEKEIEKWGGLLKMANPNIKFRP